MSDNIEIKYVFRWYALSDACPKCQALNGHEWHDQDIFQEVLWDPFYGNLWDLNQDIPLTHPHCRCQLEVRVEKVALEKIPSFQEVKQLLEEFGLNVK